MVLTLSDMISYGIAILLLFVMYKKVIAPFAKRMLEHGEKKDDELDYIGIDFDDFDLEEEDKDALLKEKMNKLRKQMTVNSDMDEDKVRYDVLLEKLRDIATERPDEVTNVLSDLTKEDEEKK